jgi:type I restriction enzyme, S subunit
MSDELLARFMGPMPTGWRKVTISECLQEVSKPILMRDSVLYRLISLRRRNEGMFDREVLYGREILTKTLQEVIPGTLVIARMQVVHGAIALAPSRFAGAAISKSYSSFVGTEICNITFFSWLVKHPLMYAYFMDASQGVVIEKMTFDQDRWLTYPIFLPPMAEQRRIAKLLDAADEAISSSEQLIAKLKGSRLALLHNLLTRGVEESGQLRDPERQSSLFTNTSHGVLPKDWKIRKIGSVAQVFNGSTPSRLRHDYWGKGGIPWLASGKVNDYEIESPSEFITERAYRESSLRLLPPGSVVVGMIGEGKTRGMAGILRIPATINQNLAGIVPGDEIDGKFLQLVLDYNYVSLRSGGRGSNQDALNTKLVAEFQVVVPNLKEQHAIVRLVTSIERRINAERAELRKLRLLKQGLMGDLLTGRVRVRTLS